jgi:lactoylglutathione lyase
MPTMANTSSAPGVAATRDAATAGFVFNHTMLRVKDARASLDFYTRVLGFSLLRSNDFPEAAFSLYFLALVDDLSAMPEDAQARQHWIAGLQGVLELTHNHGTEHQDGPVYHDGNSEPRGFGHICLSVPDLRATCARLDALGVPFQKRLQDGRMKHLAFIKDPDGYWIELIQQSALVEG